MCPSPLANQIDQGVPHDHTRNSPLRRITGGRDAEQVQCGDAFKYASCLSRVWFGMSGFPVGIGTETLGGNGRHEANGIQDNL